MSGIVRDKVRELPDTNLVEMWDEIAQWEKTGVLPEEALLRIFLRLSIEPIIGGIEVPALWLDMAAKEVWRECAVRRLEVTP